MGRLEAVEVRLSELKAENSSFRIDNEMFSKQHLKIKSLLNNINTKKLSEISTLITDFGAFSQTNFISFLDSGILFLRNQDIKSNFIDLSDNVYVSDKVYNMLSLKLDENDILIPRVGSLGKAAVVKKENLPCTANQNLAQIKINKDYSPYYISTFLNTRIANIQINSSSTGNVQQWLNLENIGKIQIPILDDVFQDIIERTILNAHSLIDEAKTLYTSAQTLLLSELGLADYTPSSESVAVKTFAASFGTSGRLDAEYYQPKYEEVERRIRNYKDGYKTLNDFIEEYSTGFPYKSDDYVDNGDCHLIRINNINNGILDVPNCVTLSTKIAMQSPKDFVNVGDVIISMSGTIGSACCITEKINAVINQRILKITPQNINGLILSLYINSMAGYMQFERIGTGGVQTNISSGDMKKILIPNLMDSVQNKISEKIQQSFALRKKSAELLDCAKQAVEIAVEHGDEAAMMWLEGKGV